MTHQLYEKALEQGPVEVEWLDSMSAPGWSPWSEIERNEVDDVDGARLVQRSTGYVLVDDEVRLVLAASIGTESGCDVMTIPRVAIRSVTALRPVSRRVAKP